MLDKTKTYSVKNQPIRKKYSCLKILFEDDISFYVESLIAKDRAGFGIRYSLKKHCFILIENKLQGENQMRKLQVGDKVDMHDGSYCFGIQDGEYTIWCDNFNGDRKRLTVVKTGLTAMENAEGHRSGQFIEVCDILVTNNDGGYWFTQSRFVNLCSPEHTVSFDGGEPVPISDQSFQALKKSLTQ